MRLIFLWTLLLSSVLSQDLVFVGESGGHENEESKVEETSDEESSKEVFIATNDWQEIKPGQSIPQGLHVRLDMQTGKKEARLMQNEETKEQREQRILESIKNIKDDLKDSPKVQGTGKSKWRSMEEIKQEMKDIDLKVTEDYLSMKALLEDLEQEKDEENQVKALEELEFHVHQYDNAVDFLQLDGIIKGVLPALNSSHDEVKRAGSLLLGGAAQSHPEVQAAAVQAGVLPLLLRLIHLDGDARVAARAFYALSSILRSSHISQQEFLAQGGLAVLASALADETAGREKVRIKALTLLNDLMLEMEGLGDLIKEAGICQVWENVLVVPRADRGAKREDHLAASGHKWPLREEHDTVGKIIEALSKVARPCRSELSTSNGLQSKLAFLQQEYSILRDREAAEGEGDIFSEIANTLDVLVKELGVVKIEL